MSHADILASSLLMVAEIAIVLATVLGFITLLTLVRRKKKSREIRAFAAFMADDPSNKLRVTQWLKAGGRSDNSIEGLAVTICEQQKLLYSSILFAYKDKGNTPLQTVKEKLDRLLEACLTPAQNVKSDDTLINKVNQLEVERENLLAEITALKAVLPASTVMQAALEKKSAQNNEVTHEPSPEIYWETENIHDDEQVH